MQYNVEDYNTTYVQNNYLRVCETYDYDEEFGFINALNEKDFLQRIKSFNQELHSSDSFLFFEVYDQHLTFWGYYEGKNEFIVGYENDATMKNQVVSTSIGEQYLTHLYAVQIDSNAYDIFSLDDKIIEGSGFVTSSYNFSYNQTLPCLLGCNYRDVYNVGDILYLEYLTKYINFEVVGFLDERASVVDDATIRYLDNYIVMPSINCTYEPNSSEEEFFQKILYDQKTCGLILNQGLDYQMLVEDLAQKYDLQYQVIDLDKNATMVNQGITSIYTQRIFTVLQLVLILLISLILILVFIQKFNADAKNTSIKLISGASLNAIKLNYFFIMLACYAISAIIAVCIVYFTYDLSYGVLIKYVAILSINVLIGIIIINIHINRYDIGASLRR